MGSYVCPEKTKGPTWILRGIFLAIKPKREARKGDSSRVDLKREEE